MSYLQKRKGAYSMGNKKLVAALVFMSAMWFLAGITVEDMWRDAHPPIVESQPTMHQSMQQISKLMNSGTIRWAWQAVYCDQRTERLLRNIPMDADNTKH